MAAISSSVAARSLAAAPITTRRMAEWPARKPRLGVDLAVEPVQVGAERVQPQSVAAASESSGMPSTRASICIR